MPKKKITKIDPRQELSPYLNHQQQQKQKNARNSKVSATLHGLRQERKHALWRRLGAIITFSIVVILLLAYYISPLADVNSVAVAGARDLPTRKVIARAGIKASDKILTYSWPQSQKSNLLGKRYPEIKSVTFKIKGVNHLLIDVQEFATIAYLKDGDGYRKILVNGKVGSQVLPNRKVEQAKPLFVGYNRRTSFKSDLRLFNSLPLKFRRQVRLLHGSNPRKKQIVLVMKDNNVVIGNVTTLKDKARYYNTIKKKAGKNSLIDLEVGAFSRPLTNREKKSYGIS